MRTTPPFAGLRLIEGAVNPSTSHSVAPSQASPRGEAAGPVMRLHDLEDDFRDGGIQGIVEQPVLAGAQEAGR